MKKNFNRFLSVLLCAVMAFTVLPCVPAGAEDAPDTPDVIASGYCGGEGDGTNLTWTITIDGTLTISGYGEMADYGFGSDGSPVDPDRLPIAPWKAFVTGDFQFRKVIVEEGVTSIGSCAFFGVNYSVEEYDSAVPCEFVLADSVRKIGDTAFAGGYYDDITVPYNVAYLGYTSSVYNNVFGLDYYTNPYERVNISRSMQIIDTLGGRLDMWYEGTEYEFADVAAEATFSEETFAPLRVHFLADGKIGGFVRDESQIDEDDDMALTYHCPSRLGWLVDSDGYLILDGDLCFRLDSSVPNPITAEIRQSVRTAAVTGITKSAGGVVFPNATDVYFEGSQEEWTASLNQAFPNAQIHYNSHKVHTDGFKGAQKLNVVEATCTSGGSYDLVGVCGTCGETYVNEHVELPAKGHYYTAPVIEDRVEPTCAAEGGYDKVVYCKDCGEELVREHVTIEALTVVASGHCGGEGDGTNLTWTLTSDGTLTISGYGEMADNALGCLTQLDASVLKSIKNIIIEDGVTSIGAGAFPVLDGQSTFSFYPDSLVLPDSIRKIGRGAFIGMVIPDEITIPANVTVLGGTPSDDVFGMPSLADPDYAEFQLNIARTMNDLGTLGGGINNIRYAGTEYEFADIIDNADYCDDGTSAPIVVHFLADGKVGGCTAIPDEDSAFDSDSRLSWVLDDDGFLILDGPGTQPTAYPRAYNYLSENRNSVTSVAITNKNFSFSFIDFEFPNVTDVYFEGTQEEWTEEMNSMFPNAEVHFNSHKVHTDGFKGAQKLNVVEATCTSGGSYDLVGICGTCGETYVNEHVELPAKGHYYTAPVIEDRVAPGCETDGGYERVVYCKDCGEEIVREHVTLEATGHDWGEWEVVFQASTEEEGLVRRECKNDPSHVETDIIPVLEYDEDEELARPVIDFFQRIVGVFRGIIDWFLRIFYKKR
ncbi:MAG: leucine-rich repeat domain-containing protein [Clostridia bacterium]|nr:leucine-rich repeat domain-containing protein [Clostridia bacterium]